MAELVHPVDNDISSSDSVYVADSILSAGLLIHLEDQVYVDDSFLPGK